MASELQFIPSVDVSPASNHSSGDGPDGGLEGITEGGLSQVPREGISTTLNRIKLHGTPNTDNTIHRHRDAENADIAEPNCTRSRNILVENTMIQPPDIPPPIAKSSDNILCPSDSESSIDSDDSEAEYRGFLMKRREERRRKRMTTGHISKRTISESWGSDTDLEDVKDPSLNYLGVEDPGSSARRLRRRVHVGEKQRSSLEFADPPPPRIEEGFEPDSDDDIKEALAKELPLHDFLSYEFEIMEIDSPPRTDHTPQPKKYEPVRIESSGSTEDSSSDNSAESECSLVSLVLNSQQREIVDKLMTEFLDLLSSDVGQQSRPASGSGTSGPAAFFGRGRPSSNGEGSPEGNGAAHEHQGRNNKGKSKAEEDEDINDTNPGSADKASASDAIQYRLACPYFKRDPLTHRETGSCTGPGWHTVHRVK